MVLIMPCDDRNSDLNSGSFECKLNSNIEVWFFTRISHRFPWFSILRHVTLLLIKVRYVWTRWTDERVTPFWVVAHVWQIFISDVSLNPVALEGIAQYAATAWMARYVMRLQIWIVELILIVWCKPSWNYGCKWCLYDAWCLEFYLTYQEY